MLQNRRKKSQILKNMKSFNLKKGTKTKQNKNEKRESRNKKKLKSKRKIEKKILWKCSKRKKRK
jgi:hypothetical protein